MPPDPTAESSPTVPRIWLRHVTKSFSRRSETRLFGTKRKRRLILKDVNLQVEKGEAVCIMGKNGSGKTTLTKILSTLIIPDEGEASVCGFDVAKEGSQVRQRIGLMLNAGEMGFQPRISGFTNLEFYAALYKIPRKKAQVKIIELFQELELADRGSDQFQSYSSGMKRRLAVARALLPDPQVLLLDEPTLGVDPWSTEQIHKQLTGQVSSGKTILYTTNNMAEATALTRQVYTLENGTLTGMK